MKSPSKSRPIKYRFTRPCTKVNGSYRARWVKEQEVSSFSQNGEHVELILKVPVSTFFDMSLAASTGRALKDVTEAPERTYIPYRRAGDVKYWQFKTSRGVEIVSSEGEPLNSVEVGSVVSARYSPVKRAHGVYLALEVIVVHVS